MQLLYLWVEKYKHIKFSSGLNFSPEYQITFMDNALKIRKNMKYIQAKNFYGDKISEITAIVGENGSGKSTTAQMILEHGGSVKAINESNKIYCENFVEVYKIKDKVEKVDKLWIYYYLSGEEIQIDYEKSDEIQKCYDVSKLNDEDYESPYYAEECEKHSLTTIYLSNVFDPKDLGSLSHLSVFKEGKNFKQLSYTPSLCLRLSQSIKKEQYGQNIGGLILARIDTYASRMLDNILRDYIDYQALLFIRCYKTSTKSIIQKLNIFRVFSLGVHQFGSYLRGKSEKKFDEFDKEVNLIAKSIGKINNDNKNLFLQCFINILCEAYLFFGYKDKEKKSNIANEIDIYIKSKDYKINIKLLESIHDNILNLNSRDKNFSKLHWFKQLCSSIEIFNRYKEKAFLVGYHDFEEKDSAWVLDFFMDEVKKEYSFFKKYLIFEPIPASTGELALANLFAYINDAFSKSICSNVLLIIDELDANLHPRWQQMILKNLIEYLNENKQEKNIQIIFTSHSPIMLSDMTKDRVIMLKRREDTTLVETCNQPILGANILKLFYDNFFMDEGSIGEIAKEKIKKVIEYNKGNSNIPKEKVDYIISNIGEPIVQRKLRCDFNFRNQNDKKVKSELYELSKKIGYEKAIKILKTSMKEDYSDD